MQKPLSDAMGLTSERGMFGTGRLPMERLMSNDLSRSPTAFEQNTTLVAVIEMSLSSWLVAGLVPGIERQPLKKLDPDEEALLKLLHRWRDEAVKTGFKITRTTGVFEASRDGFWLARWLRMHEIEAYVIHNHRGFAGTSAREDRPARHRTAEALVFRLAAGRTASLQHGHDSDSRGGRGPAAEPRAREPSRPADAYRQSIKACLARFGVRNFKPTLRKASEHLETLSTPEVSPLPPNTLDKMRRDMACLRFVMDQIKEIEAACLKQLEQAPEDGPLAMVKLVVGVIECTRSYRATRGPKSGGALRRSYRLAGRERQKK